MASITTGIIHHGNARFIRAEEIQQHPKFPPAMKNGARTWTVPHPRKRRIQADSPLWGIELTTGERKLYRFFLLEADNGTSDNGETIWPEHPEMYDGSSLYEKLEAYVPFINGNGFRDIWGIPNLYVLFVFRDAGRMKRTMEKFESLGGSRFILFQPADPAAPPDYLFARPWERVGFEPLFLNQP